MTDENKKANALSVYASLCDMFDEKGMSCTKQESDLSVDIIGSGEDIPMSFHIVVDAGRQLLRVYSKMPFKVPEDKRMDFAIACCVAGYNLRDGSFDYNIATGDTFFRLTASFIDSRIGKGLLEYIFGVSVAIVDEYNDKFFALAKGLMSLEDFIEKCK